MKRFLRNFIIILACNLCGYFIATMDAIPNNWTLEIMFIAGAACGAILAGLDAAAYDKEIDKLNTKIDYLQRIRKSLNIND